MKSKNITPNNSMSLDEYILYDNINVDEYHDVFDYEKVDEPFKNDNAIHKCNDTQTSLSDLFDCELASDSSVDYVSKKLNSIDDNLCVHKLNGKYYIKQFRVYCPECYSKNVIMYGNKSKPIIIDKEGLVDCEIKQYKCNCCNHRFSADISSIVRPKANISNEILEIVRKYYSVFSTSLRKIKEGLRVLNNVKISHQEIQDIIRYYSKKYVSKLKEFSGYYAFDSLWVKINEISDDHIFLLVLVDVKHKTIVAYKLVEKETEEVIYNFLREATHNQPRIGITTDLKIEYRNPIAKLNFKHQFCIFHAKQNIQRYIRDYVKENNLPDEKIGEYYKYLKEIYKIFYVDSQLKVLEIIDDLKKRAEEFPEVINEIINKKIQPYSAYLTRYLEDSSIAKTSNMIEGIFANTFPKSIKNNYLTEDGFLSRFNIKFERWEQRNGVF